MLVGIEIQTSTYIFHDIWKTPSANKDRVIRSKAPDYLLNGPYEDKVLPTAVSNVRNDIFFFSLPVNHLPLWGVFIPSLGTTHLDHNTFKSPLQTFGNMETS